MRRQWLILVLLFLSSCEGDWRKVQSPTQPATVYWNGTTWVALFRTGTSDQWFYVPEEVAVAAACEQSRDGLAFNVLAADQLWKVTKAGDGASIDDPIDPPGIGPSPETIWGWLAVIGISLVSAVWGVASRVQLAQSRELVAAGDREIRILKNEDKLRQNTFNQEKAEFERSRQRAQRELSNARNALAATTDKLVAERDELEQAKKDHAITLRKEAAQIVEVSPQEYQKQSAAVREVGLKGSAAGWGFFVKYALDTRRAPGGTWPCAFDCEITLDRPYPPTLLVFRNGKIIRRETNRVRNQFADFLKPGTRYRYRFVLVDGRRRMGDPAVFELTPPPFEACEPPTALKVSDEECKRKKAAAYEERAAFAKATIADPVKLERKLAAIQQELNDHYQNE